jgi:hypothetical protein
LKSNKTIYVAIIIGGIVAAAAIYAAVFSSAPSTANQALQSDSEAATNAEIFPIDSRPYGKSYGEWTGAGWKWFQEIPFEVNPANDDTGEYCGTNQNDDGVWYFPGTFGGKQERDCTIPGDRALVIMVAGASCSYAEDATLKTPEDLRQCAVDNSGGMTLRASIDGVEVDGVEDYYSVSPVFPVTLPNDNVWGVPGPVESEFVVAGWTLVIEPLPEGEHVLQFSAEERDQLLATSQPVWSIEAVYNLTVTDDTNSD